MNIFTYIIEKNIINIGKKVKNNFKLNNFNDPLAILYSSGTT